jgi:hypothetical protein
MKLRIFRIRNIRLFVFLLLIIPTGNVLGIYNHPPSTPIINGPINGILGDSYPYYIWSSDPDGDKIYYNIRWGDCMAEFNNGPYNSSEEILLYHAFCNICFGPGDFYIRIQAVDEYGSCSDWGVLAVYMSKSNYNDNLYTLMVRFFNQYNLLKNI